MKDLNTVNLTREMLDTSSLGTANEADSINRMAELNAKYDELTAAIAASNQADRKAEAAKYEAEIATANVHRLRNTFLLFAGQHCKKVADWSYWPLPPTKDENGDILLQTPISEKELRKHAAVVGKSIRESQNAALTNANGEGPEQYDRMFGGDNEENTN